MHPFSEVQVATTAGSGEGGASTFTWDGPDMLGNPIVAFRVIKEHREPRKWWLVTSARGDAIVFCDNPEDAQLRATQASGRKIIPLQEVLPE